VNERGLTAMDMWLYDQKFCLVCTKKTIGVGFVQFIIKKGTIRLILNDKLLPDGAVRKIQTWPTEW
jgi:hypothetical protein